MDLAAHGRERRVNLDASELLNSFPKRALVDDGCQVGSDEEPDWIRRHKGLNRVPRPRYDERRVDRELATGNPLRDRAREANEVTLAGSKDGTTISASALACAAT